MVREERSLFAPTDANAIVRISRNRISWDMIGAVFGFKV
jgi:hypothetical protein